MKKLFDFFSSFSIDSLIRKKCSFKFIYRTWPFSQLSVNDITFSNILVFLVFLVGNKLRCIPTLMTIFPTRFLYSSHKVLIRIKLTRFVLYHPSFPSFVASQISKSIVSTFLVRARQGNLRRGRACSCFQILSRLCRKIRAETRATNQLRGTEIAKKTSKSWIADYPAQGSFLKLTYSRNVT